MRAGKNAHADQKEARMRSKNNDEILTFQISEPPRTSTGWKLKNLPAKTLRLIMQADGRGQLCGFVVLDRHYAMFSVPISPCSNFLTYILLYFYLPISFLYCESDQIRFVVTVVS